MISPNATGWRRVGERRRLLVIEHPDGSIEEAGFVTVVSLVYVDGDDVRAAIEWKDEHAVTRTAFTSADGRGEVGSISVPLDGGEFEIWHFDEEALGKLHGRYREGI